MWNNFINLREIPYLLRRLRAEPDRVRALLGRLPLAGRGRVAAAWAHTESAARNWWDIPLVVARWNRMVSGDPTQTPRRYVAGKYLRGRTGLRGLSLGCGDGSKELEWAATGVFRRLEGWDLSASRIATAREQAASHGLADRLEFKTGDVHAIPMDAGVYDVIIADNALHHFTPLAPVMRRIHDALAHDGIFYLDEFVGPSRFQWTDRQMRAVNDRLAAMPDDLKRMPNSRHTKLPVIRPSRLGMILRDPSEAVESGRIMTLLPEVFDVKEVRGYGGAVLHLLFAGIAQHFMTPDDAARRVLASAFAMEDSLLASGEVAHDFVVAVCGRRG
jgi:SAM-dependent methyltransferase